LPPGGIGVVGGESRRLLPAVLVCQDVNAVATCQPASHYCQRCSPARSRNNFGCAETLPNRVGVPKAMPSAHSMSSSRVSGSCSISERCRPEYCVAEMSSSWFSSATWRSRTSTPTDAAPLRHGASEPKHLSRTEGGGCSASVGCPRPRSRTRRRRAAARCWRAATEADEAARDRPDRVDQSPAAERDSVIVLASVSGASTAPHDRVIANADWLAVRELLTYGAVVALELVLPDHARLALVDVITIGPARGARCA